MLAQLPQVHRPCGEQWLNQRHRVWVSVWCLPLSSNGLMCGDKQKQTQVREQIFLSVCLSVCLPLAVSSSRHLSHCVCLSIVCLHIGRVSDRAVIGSLRLCHLTVVFSCERGGQQRKTRFTSDREGPSVNHALSPLAVVRDGWWCVGEVDKGCRADLIYRRQCSFFPSFFLFSFSLFFIFLFSLGQVCEVLTSHGIACQSVNAMKEMPPVNKTQSGLWNM